MNKHSQYLPLNGMYLTLGMMQKHPHFSPSLTKMVSNVLTSVDNLQHIISIFFYNINGSFITNAITSVIMKTAKGFSLLGRRYPLV